MRIWITGSEEAHYAKMVNVKYHSFNRNLKVHLFRPRLRPGMANKMSKLHSSFVQNLFGRATGCNSNRRVQTTSTHMHELDMEPLCLKAINANPVHMEARIGKPDLVKGATTQPEVPPRV